MKIENTQQCMVTLWRMLARTETILRCMHKRFCPHNILKLWHNEDIIKASPAEGGWEATCLTICSLSELMGYDLLQHVSLYPRKHRELLRAIIAVSCGIGMRQVDLKALDSSFSMVFPNAVRINLEKKKRVRQRS